MSSTRGDWAKAFWIQGKSDFIVYELLNAQSRDAVPLCHALHYLQMACEKIGKAYRARDSKAALHGEDGILGQHVGFVKFIRAFLLSPSIKSSYVGRDAQLQTVMKEATSLARAIETLAPAVDSDTTPENAEYPWEANGCIVIPCEHAFSNLSMLSAVGGGTFLKLLRRAVKDFEKIQIN